MSWGLPGSAPDGVEDRPSTGRGNEECCVKDLRSGRGGGRCWWCICWAGKFEVGEGSPPCMLKPLGLEVDGEEFWDGFRG